MALTFPRDLVLRAYLGRWVDVTALAENRSLRQVEPVVVSWGSNAEQGKVPPSTVEGVLNNAGGHWTPGNPLSDYYDYLQGRNVPTELALRASRDTFTRTVPSDWGTSDTGDGWNGAVVGSGSQSVSGGAGVHVVSTTNSYQLSFLGDSYADCRVAASGTAAFSDVTGGSIEPLNLVLRYQTSGPLSGEHYLLRVVVNTAEVVTVAIFHSVLGPLTSAVTVTGLADAAHYRAKFQVEGQTLRGKVYRPGPVGDPDQYEPLDWQVTAHHDRLTAGSPGVRSGIASGNTNIPVTFTCDDWELLLLRHCGELTRLQPSWDETHRIKKATFKLAGISQRLGRPNTPSLPNPVRLYLAATNPRRWWPLDDPSFGTQAGAPLAGASPVTITRTGLGQNQLWGLGDLGAHLPPSLLVDFKNLDNLGTPLYRIEADCPESTASGSLVFDFLFRSTAVVTGTDNTQLRLELNPVSLVGQMFTLELNPSTAGSFVGGPSLSTVTFTATQMFDTQPHHVRFRAAQLGGNVLIEVSIDGVSVAAFQYVTLTLANLTSYLIHGTSGGIPSVMRPYVLSNIVIWTGGTEPNLAATVSAMLGRPGEKALDRAIRLCAQEGVPLDYWGDPAATRAMGRQRRDLTLMEALQECAETGGDLLFEPRYAAGFAYRSRRSLCARPPDATLSYASGQVGPEFAMSADDRPSANYVIATDEITGGTFLAERTSGPMNTKVPGTDPDAIGRSPQDVRANTHGPPVLADVAGWTLALGTVPEVRFPRVTVNYRATEVTATVQRAVTALTVGDRFLVTGLASADVYRDLDQMVRGGREVFKNVRQHQVTLNTAPYEKYRAGTYDDAASRYDGAVTTLDAQLTAGTTGARNVTTTAGQVWTQAAGAYPLDVLIGGERVTISGVTGTGAAQVMTISARAINGVAKTHPAGTRVYLYQPVYYC